jgi:hypothetical protein
MDSNLLEIAAHPWPGREPKMVNATVWLAESTVSFTVKFARVWRSRSVEIRRWDWVVCRSQKKKSHG